MPTDEKDINSSNNINNLNLNNSLNEDYCINLNDIIKLGRVKYAVNEIATETNDCLMKYSNQNTQSNSEDEIEKQNYDLQKLNNGTSPVFNFIHLADVPQMDSDEILCKICYSSQNDPSNPLVNLCNVCTGGIKYSHFSCLKIWMQTKLSIKENNKKNVKSYNIKQYNCEICKTPYPCKLRLNS